jgi:O-antigen ligase
VAGIALPAYPATQALLFATAALAPAYVIRWHVGRYPSTLLEAAIVLTVGVFLVESALSRETPAWRSPLTLPAVLFLVASALAVLAAPSRAAALGIYRAYMLEPAALALVIASVVRTYRQGLVLITGFFAGASVLAIANTDLVVGLILHHKLNVHGPAPSAIYNSPNSVALYLVPLLAVAGSVVLYGTSRAGRVVAAVFVLIAAPASVLTFSRGGWATLAAVMVALAVSHRRRWWLLAGLAVVAVLVVIAVPDIPHRALLLLRSGDGNTSGDRIRLWSMTLTLLSHRPIFGTGLSGFETIMTPLWKGDATWILYPHNLALDVWTETGLLGLLSFAWLFGAAAWISWVGWRRGAPGWRAIHLGVLVALLAILVHGAIDNPYFKNDLSVEFWALVALTWAGRRWGRPPASGGG